MEEQNLSNNLITREQSIEPSKKNKTYVLGWVVAASLALLFIFLVLVYILVPGKKAPVAENSRTNENPVVTATPDEMSGTAITGSDEIADIDQDLGNTEIPSIDADLNGIEGQLVQ